MDDMQQKKPLLPDPPAIETKKLLSVLAGILLLTACMIFQRLYGGVEMLPLPAVSGVPCGCRKPNPTRHTWGLRSSPSKDPQSNGTH